MNTNPFRSGGSIYVSCPVSEYGFEKYELYVAGAGRLYHHVTGVGLCKYRHAAKSALREYRDRGRVRLCRRRGSSSYNPTGGTYQVTPFLNNYKTSNNATTLNQSSLLTKAAGAATSCGSMSPSNYDGVYGTYYAGVLYAAQSALVAQQAANPGSENVLILLSDGDSTASPQQATGASPNHYGQNYDGYEVFPSPSTGNGFLSIMVWAMWPGDYSRSGRNRGRNAGLQRCVWIAAGGLL